jgi:hypothetical protein
MDKRKSQNSSKSKRNNIETDAKIDTPYTRVHERTYTFLTWYRHLYKSGGVKLILWTPNLLS